LLQQRAKYRPGLKPDDLGNLRSCYRAPIDLVNPPLFKCIDSRWKESLRGAPHRMRDEVYGRSFRGLAHSSIRGTWRLADTIAPRQASPLRSGAEVTPTCDKRMGLSGDGGRRGLLAQINRPQSSRVYGCEVESTLAILARRSGPASSCRLSPALSNTFRPL
jgi:hypothetical protein